MFVDVMDSPAWFLLHVLLLKENFKKKETKSTSTSTNAGGGKTAFIVVGFVCTCYSVIKAVVISEAVLKKIHISKVQQQKSQPRLTRISEKTQKVV